METFANYILTEKDFKKKVEIAWYLQKKINIFFDNSCIFKALIAKLFIETMKIDVDENIITTALLLCSCKKVNNAQDMEKIRLYAKEGSELLLNLGFSPNFCKICEEQNRYSGSKNREKESDIIELVDQFGGMMVDRPERRAFPIDEAIVLLEYRNLKGLENKYLQQFKEFVNIEKEIVA